MSEIVKVEAQPLHAAYMTTKDLVTQVKLVQEVMSSVMQENTHYGRIPGTDKPTLLQPGAQVLNLTFRLSPTFETAVGVLELTGHREYTTKCTLISRADGTIVAEGVGSASTMESKYRYRNVADFEVTGDPIPEDAKERKREYRAKGYGMKKVDGVWEWVKYGDSERSENPDIADTYNTVLKMAAKRALIHATLNATGASDMFTQDVEDLPQFSEAVATPKRDYSALTALKARWAESKGVEPDEAGRQIVDRFGNPRGLNDAAYRQYIDDIEADLSATGVEMQEEDIEF